MHDPAQLQGSLGHRELSARGSVMCCIWLTDILYALHIDLGVNSFSARELWTKMPSSPHQFQDIYQILVSGNEIQLPLPADLTAADDAVLLLIAIMSDLLYLKRSLPSVITLPRARQALNERFPSNPFIPFAPQTELNRLRSILNSALDNWALQFQSLVAPDILALYHYSRLHLACSDVLDLPRLAGYKPVSGTTTITHRNINISDRAVRMAWLVLDSAAERSKEMSASSESLCSIWLPICVFHAALVVWAHQSLNSAQQEEERRSSKMLLLAFKVELESMTWPCCPEMAATLERLMVRAPALDRNSTAFVGM